MNRRTLLTGTTAAVALAALPVKVKRTKATLVTDDNLLTVRERYFPADKWELVHLEGLTYHGQPDRLDQWKYTFERVA